MLKSLLVENYQSHKSSEVEFVSGVNVICGISQSGKTALLRALNLVIDNRPRGSDFIRHGAESAVVSVIGERDSKMFSVTREKGESENSYHITVGDEEAEFGAFGVGVPEKVEELLNISDVNIQDQLSPYFLVLDPPGQIALYIRSIAKLDEIDDIIAMLASKIRITGADVKTNVEDIKEVDEKLKILQKIDLVKLEKNLDVYEELGEAGDKLNSEADNLRRIIASLDEVEKELEKANSIDLHHLAIQYSKCVDFSLKKNNIEIEIYSLDSIVRGLEEVEAVKINIPDGILKRSNFWVEKYIKLKDECDKLDSLLCDMNVAFNGISDTIVDLEKAKLEREGLLALISKCPYCDSVLTDETRNHLIGKTCLIG